MNEIPMLDLVLFAGILLGAIFFGGLWWTVSKGVSAKRPALWFIVSLLLRTGIVLAGFYLVSGGSWKRLLACLFGFVIARFIVAKLTAIPMAIPLSNSSDGTTGHSSRQVKNASQADGDLPQAGEREAGSLRDARINGAGHAP